MLKKLIATLSVLSLVVVASANTVTLEPVSYVRPAMDIAENIDAFEAGGWETYDLVVHVDADDAWTTAYALATADLFWDHLQGGDTADPGNFGYFGLLEYDTFWTSSEDYPNVDTGGTDTTFAPGNPLQNTATVKEAEWYVDPVEPNVGSGDWTIARYTVATGQTLCVEGNLYYTSTLGEPQPYAVCVPEPASLGLLGLGALALIRRR